MMTLAYYDAINNRPGYLNVNVRMSRWHNLIVATQSRINRFQRMNTVNGRLRSSSE